MKTLVTLFISPVILLATSAAISFAWADEPPAQPKQDRAATQAQTVFAAIDRNGDERISKDEAARAKTLRHRFAAVDSSGDGYLSRDEFMARPSNEPFE